jgi:serine/threonine protein kinase
VGYVDDSSIQRKCVFKHVIIVQRRKWIWNELHLTKGLPGHPHLVPFDRVVVDDVQSRILGFTTVYIPGGTLDENRSRVFRLEWLQQLFAVVDYLNLELGILHQDIAPRNLLIDPTTRNLRLCDFDRAARVGSTGCLPGHDDITGVIFTLYEITTHDEHFREVQFEEQDAETIQELEQWPVKSQLDCDVAIFREHLNDWVRRRKEPGEVADAEQVNGSFDIPDIPPPSPRITGEDENGEHIVESRLLKEEQML